MEKKPRKKIFQKNKIESLRYKAIQEIRSRLLPDRKIIRIILIGSSVKDTFGKYEPPGFRGSLFSDFDFIIFVEDDYNIPEWLDKEPDGRPFPDSSMNLAFRNKGFIDDKYDTEVFFIKRKSMQDSKIQEQGELAGIPMTPDSKHKHIVVYTRG